MGRFYATPIIVSPVKCDNPRKCVPSNHFVPNICPVNNTTTNEQKQYTGKTAACFLYQGFCKADGGEDWASVREDDSAGAQEEALQDILTRFLDKTTPTKTIKLAPKTNHSWQRKWRFLSEGERKNTWNMANHRNIWILLILLVKNSDWQYNNFWSKMLIVWWNQSQAKLIGFWSGWEPILGEIVKTNLVSCQNMSVWGGQQRSVLTDWHRPSLTSARNFSCSRLKTFPVRHRISLKGN